MPEQTYHNKRSLCFFAPFLFGVMVFCGLLSPLTAAEDAQKTEKKSETQESKTHLVTNEEDHTITLSEAFEDEELYTDKMTDLDPLEPLNRCIFTLNTFVDGLLIRPLAYAYDDLVPNVMKSRVHSFIQNLGTPIVFVNDLLQGEGEQALNSLLRFVFNSTFGILGLFDVADDMGLDHKDNDFDQTFRRWGIGAGPYIVLPLFGPSSFRNIAGDTAEFFVDPYNWYMRTHYKKKFLGTKGGRQIYLRTAVRALLKRHQYLEVTEKLDKTEDPYAQYRILYMQNRQIVDALEESAIPENVIKNVDHKPEPATAKKD